MGQPRRNERRFYRYPLHRIVAVIDDAPSLGLALADLGAAGYDLSKVNVLSGPQGATLLDPTGVRRGGHHLLHYRRWTIEEVR
jgi:hypothetical protein